ncbi:unnamed protein product, partial [marine sediment metagenome]
ATDHGTNGRRLTPRVAFPVAPADGSSPRYLWFLGCLARTTNFASRLAPAFCVGVNGAVPAPMSFFGFRRPHVGHFVGPRWLTPWYFSHV